VSIENLGSTVLARWRRGNRAMLIYAIHNSRLALRICKVTNSRESYSQVWSQQLGQQIDRPLTYRSYTSAMREFNCIFIRNPLHNRLVVQRGSRKLRGSERPNTTLARIPTQFASLMCRHTMRNWSSTSHPQVLKLRLEVRHDILA
jgi:hypothetical protein